MGGKAKGEEVRWLRVSERRFRVRAREAKSKEERERKR